MKHIGKSFVLATALFAATNAGAEELFPYIGADFSQTYMRARSQWNLIFPKSYPGASLYVGTRFHQNFGLELGYDWSGRRTKDYVLPNGTPFFGNTITSPNGLRGSTKIRRTGGYLDLLGSVPVAECVELFGSLGFGWVQTKIVTSFSSEAVGASPTSSAIASTSGKGRGALRLGIGGIFMVTETVGVRAKINWSGTSSLQLKGNATFDSLGYEKKGFKGSTSLLAGLFVRF